MEERWLFGRRSTRGSCKYPIKRTSHSSALVPLHCLLFIFCGRAAGEDLTLHYTRLSNQWVMARPIGNGRRGATMFGASKKKVFNFTKTRSGPAVPTNQSTRMS